MRLAYLDEAGISNPTQEPYCVVAGVLVNADHQWKIVEQRLAEIANEYAPNRIKGTFAFHAKDISNGSGLFHRDNPEWPREKRIQLMHDLCAVPAKLDLIVVFGFVARKRIEDQMPNMSRNELAVSAQVYAALQCTVQVEMYMQSFAGSEEVAMLIYEDNRACRSLIKKSHNFFRMIKPPPVLSGEVIGFYPPQRVIDTAHFADKTDTSLIQLADVCAFVLKRRLMKTPDSKDLCTPLYKQMAFRKFFPEET